MNSVNYDILTERTVAPYVRRRPELAALVDARSLDVREVGDGNLNLVFVCHDAAGASLVLKQSLPYVRVAGPSWPLTADRSHAEARRGLRAAAYASPDTSPRLLGYDREQHVLAMEDLSHLTVWRTALNEGRVAPHAIAQCGRHVARLLFHTGTLTLTPQAHREAAARSTNRALCAITEALVFDEPFNEHPNNSYVAALRSPIRSLQADTALRREVGRLERCFTTRPEALVHGDLHTGSVMVGENPAGCPVTKVIDPEFCFYGPVAFDLGTLLANVMFAKVSAGSCGNDAQRQWLDSLPAELWRAFTEELWTLWPRRVAGSTTEHDLATWLDDVARDALGFAGCEAVRRVIGFAKVTDIETLPADLHVAAATEVLTIARGWLADSAAASATTRPPAAFPGATDRVAHRP